ncbi:MAG: MATE family efflux transporter [Candidatus Riflebacteria bacterium]|nr:MATE family efflux transporter [Candidatus Riflebacteria bacterium]
MSFSVKDLFKPRSMTHGTPWKSILIFAIPLIIGDAAQQLYNTVDAIVAGRFIGDSALSAVGASLGPTMLSMLAFMGLSLGIGIMVSQYYGAKDRESLSYTIGNGIFLTAVILLILMPLAFYFIKPLLILIKTPPEILDATWTYLVIFILGMPGTAYYNMLSGILRGLGDSYSALLFLLLATFLNTVLDLVFVLAFGGGVGSLALATAISQSISAVFCYIKLKNMKEDFSLELKHFKPKTRFINRILSLGLPSSLTQAVFAVAGMIIQSVTNSFGADVVAVSVVVMRIDGFAMMSNFSFGMAMTTFTGQNVGAGKKSRIALGVKQGMVLALSVCSTVVLFILLFSKYLVGMFTQTESIMDFAVYALRVLSPGYLLFAVSQCMQGVMKGAGDTISPLVMSILTAVFIRVGATFTFKHLSATPDMPGGKPESIYWALSLTWVLGALITYLVYKMGYWKKTAELSMTQPQGSRM